MQSDEPKRVSFSNVVARKIKKNETKKRTIRLTHKKQKGERKSKAKKKIVKAEELRERVEQLGALTTKVSKSSFLGCIVICLFGLTRAIESIPYATRWAHKSKDFHGFVSFLYIFSRQNP